MSVLNEIAERSEKWHRSRGLSFDPSRLGNKLAEEAGEVHRALVGILEYRDGRGDIVQESAQTLIVLLSLLRAVRPDVDLLDAVLAEMERIGA